MIRRLLTVICLLGIGMLADAAVRLSPIFSSHMVLQQNCVTGIWGTADAGRNVTVITSWDSASYTATAGIDGRWRVDVSTPSYGGPYTVSVSCGRKDRIVLEDVLIGEVWLCGGQSNMEMTMRAKVVGAEKDMMDISDNPGIRILHVDTRISPIENSEPTLVGDGWNTCEYGNLHGFSAAAFYFGRALNRELGIPVGLIESCWGGSRISPWISSSTISLMPEEASDTLTEDEIADFKGDCFEENLAAWDRKVTRLAEHSITDRSGWLDCTVPGTIENALKCPDFNGLFWMRKSVDIPANLAGKDMLMILDAVDDYDFAYFDGEYIGHGEGYTTVRQYHVPGRLVKAGKNMITLRVLDIEGDAGIYEASGSNFLAVPGGKDFISLNGQWQARLDRSIDCIPAFPEHETKFNIRPSVMYNAMIAPLVGYDIRGVIWYQGCSNVSDPQSYTILQPMLIHDWRAKWGHDFPFYITQLANFDNGQPDSGMNWALLREAQAMSAKNVSGSGMACTIDIGEADDIHPKDKVDVGERLALQALAKTYGKNVICSGPQYAGYSIEGNSIRIRFNNCDGGLKTGHRDTRRIVTEFVDEAVDGFIVAGPDRKFRKADAVIEGDCVVLSCEGIECPVAARYAWDKSPSCNLVNGCGLPAEPFRTDNWK